MDLIHPRVSRALFQALMESYSPARLAVQQYDGEDVFATIKTLWRDAKQLGEARLGEVIHDALSLLQAYDRMNPNQRHTFTRAYYLAKIHLEEVHGDHRDWKKDDQLKAAETLMLNARKAVDAEPRGAMGIALLSLFLEVNTLTGKEAVKLSSDIEHWYDRAVDSDLNPE